MASLDDGGRLARAGATHPDVRSLAGVQRRDERRIEEAAADEGRLDVNVRVLLRVRFDQLCHRVDGAWLAVEPDGQRDRLVLRGGGARVDKAPAGRGTQAERGSILQKSAA